MKEKAHKMESQLNKKIIYDDSRNCWRPENMGTLRLSSQLLLIIIKLLLLLLALLLI